MYMPFLLKQKVVLTPFTLYNLEGKLIVLGGGKRSWNIPPDYCIYSIPVLVLSMIALACTIELSRASVSLDCNCIRIINTKSRRNLSCSIAIYLSHESWERVGPRCPHSSTPGLSYICFPMGCCFYIKPTVAAIIWREMIVKALFSVT